MSELIDDITKSAILSSWSLNSDGKWYVAKPLPFYSYKIVLNRIKDAVRIIRGKSFAVHYKEDEK